MRVQINVAAPVLARNRRRGSNDRPIIVRTYGQQPDEYQMAHGVQILGPDGQVLAELKHEAHSVWLETSSAVVLVDPKFGLDQ